MKRIIRKISIGSNYPDGVLHYQIGKIVKLNRVPFEITRIELNEDDLILGVKSYDIFISNETGTVLWKNTENMPVVIENNVNFD